MTTISIQLDDDKARALQDKAAKYGLSLDKLVAASIDDLVNQTEPNFKRAMKRVISENQELYRRLA